MMSCCKILSIFVLLGFNAGIQLLVVFKVFDLNKMHRTSQNDLVFYPNGNCERHDVSTYAAAGVTGVTQESNWDCGELFPMLMSNVSWLDKNKDGYWSEEDDLEAKTKLYTKHFNKGGDLA